MQIKDTFNHKTLWGGVGFSCGFCKHQANDEEWPNIRRDYKCALHDVSLAVEINSNGYMEGEWFCRDFEDNGNSYPPALRHLAEIHGTLPENTLFRFRDAEDFLEEIPFSELEKHR